MEYLYTAIFTVFSLLSFAQSNDLNESVTYSELIGRYQDLSNKSNNCDLISFGITDSGEPLHLFIMNADGEFYPEAFKKKAIVLIQNGIHAGESCGIDACIEWAEELINNNTIPDNVIIGIIPVYNIGGMKNRKCCSRANQNGPRENGFRGNARNLDLNRDYIKADSKNAFAFYRLFHWLTPELFIDTHTSNGADYQYTMTLLTTRKERLDAHLSGYLVNKLEPYIYANYDSLTPYVNVFGTTPNAGIKSFNDLPRFATGYAALFNCIGFTTEAHMWKSFNDRKKSTDKFIRLLTIFADKNYEEIKKNKNISDNENPMGFESINLEIDTTQYDEIQFLSYKPEYRYSEILGRKQVYYNRGKPQTISILHYNYYKKINEIHVPKYYVVSSSWYEVVDRLKANNIEMEYISSDTVLTGVGEYIESFKSGSQPFEGHFLHQQIVSSDSVISMAFSEGDFLISTQQKGWRYVLNVLEPESEDSFFAWNFYDEIVQQKEWYSAYIFEPYAQKMLEENPVLESEYNQKLERDPQFENGDYRLYWLYTKSKFYEKEHNRMPFLKIY